MKRDKKRLRKQDLYFLSKQTVVIDDFESDGFILDIGGGGEGVIGQLKGKQVVSIDLNKGELLEAANGPLKIVMDATELRFLDDSFSSVTAFYSLMYMGTCDHERVFSEVFRVLQDEGLFRIWDVQVSHKQRTNKPGFAVPVEVILPDRKISVGYGSHWPEKKYDLNYYIEIATKTGLQVVEKNPIGDSLFLVLQKSIHEKGNVG
jgi:ubiquinone/menaquinone biosynthesis C-methylase UbiE